MTDKPTSKDAGKLSGIVHPGMMGDGTEEQNLNERGNPAARVTKADIEAAFSGKPKPKAGGRR